jgi:uncharacterized protein (DUF1015 family)
MVKVKPFKGFVAKKELAKYIIAPPYDTVTTEEARQIAAGNKYCFLRVSRPEIDLDDHTDPYSSTVYNYGASNLDFFLRKEWLV